MSRPSGHDATDSAHNPPALVASTDAGGNVSPARVPHSYATMDESRLLDAVPMRTRTPVHPCDESRTCPLIEGQYRVCFYATAEDGHTEPTHLCPPRVDCWRTHALKLREMQRVQTLALSVINDSLDDMIAAARKTTDTLRAAG